MAMHRIGDDSAGFSVDLPGTGGVLVKCWGFWKAEIALAFAPAVTETCAKQPRGTNLVLDMSDIKPMREEGQHSFSRLMASLPSLGVGRVSVVTTNALAKLQLVRLVTESRTAASVEWVAGTTAVGRNA